MSNPFFTMRPPGSMRPTMNLRLVRVDRIDSPRLTPYLMERAIDGRMDPCQLQQEWVSDDASVREWRPIEVVDGRP